MLLLSLLLTQREPYARTWTISPVFTQQIISLNRLITPSYQPVHVSGWYWWLSVGIRHPVMTRGIYFYHWFIIWLACAVTEAGTDWPAYPSHSSKADCSADIARSRPSSRSGRLVTIQRGGVSRVIFVIRVVMYIFFLFRPGNARLCLSIIWCE